MPAGTWPPSASLITHRSGLYYGTGPLGNATRALANNTNWYAPLEIPAVRTYDRIAFEATVQGTTASLRTGIYLDNGGVPGALVLDAGALLITGVATFETVIAQLLVPGLVWLCAVQQGAAVNATVKATGGQGDLPFVGGTGITGPTQGNANGYNTSAGNGDAGALSNPANLTGLGSSAAVPIVALRAA